jgi:hypothetical protein
VQGSNLCLEELKSFSLDRSENKPNVPLMYYNLISRTFPNAHTSAKESFDNCYDCAREVQIMEEYTKKCKMCAVVLHTNIHH